MANILMAAYTNYRRDPRVKREAEALVEAGHTVTFLSCRQRDEPNREVIGGVEVRKFPSVGNAKTSTLGYMLDYGLFFVLVFFHLARHPFLYSLIHINNMPDFLVFAAIVPRVFGRPVIHDVHDLMPELYAEKFGVDDRHWMIRMLKVQERWAGAFASAVLTVEDRLVDILDSRGTPRAKVRVLMNLPDDRIFAQRQGSTVREATKPFLMVYHGTLARRLGLDIAIEALAQVREHIPAFEFSIIGAGEERAGLIDLRDRLGLRGYVSFSDGFVPVERIPELIRAADLGLVPLRISSGTDIMLPTKLLEYVSVGIPCVVPRTPTISRYFDDRMVQFFEAENPQSLAAAIIELHDNEEKRINLAREATERFARTYTWSLHKRIYVELVRSLIAGAAA